MEWDEGEGGEGVKTYAEPVDDVAVGWVAGAAGELFFAGGVDGNGVFEGSFARRPGQL